MTQFDPVGSKKGWRGFPATGLLEIDLGEQSDPIPKRKTPNSHISGAKTRADVHLKGPFSTDWQIRLHKNWPKVGVNEKEKAEKKRGEGTANPDA